MIAGSSRAQTCNQMTHTTQSQLPSLLLCICSEAAVWQSCPGSGLNVAGSCRHCWRPDCCCARLCIEHFVPFTVVILHCGILLSAVGFDSKHCMLWGGQELPGVQLLGCVSWPFISPASALAPRLGGCPAYAGTLWGEQVGKQPVQRGQCSRNDSLAPGPPHGWWEITSIHSCKASLEHNTTPNSRSLPQQQYRGVNPPICFNFCCSVPFWFMPSFATQMCVLFKLIILIPLPEKVPQKKWNCLGQRQMMYMKPRTIC